MHRRKPPGPPLALLRLRLLLLLALGSTLGCGDDDDVLRPDGGATTDGGVVDMDASVADAGFDGSASDAAIVDGGVIADGGAAGVGTITGTCGEIDEMELLSPEPFLFENAIDFPMMFTMTDEMALSEGAQEILRDGTAGGSSGYSEAFAFEVLHRCDGAELIKSETEIVYDATGSITDILVEIDGHKVGVSVTRAFVFPVTAPYTVDAARMLLERKLGDILESSANVSEADAWVKQILHVIAYAPMHAMSMAAAWDLVDASLRADTILVITVTDGMDDFLY